MTVFWFRRDLRTGDNRGLYEALSAEDKVLPIFIFDPNILDELPKGDARVTFIHNRLEAIQYDLREHNRSLATFHDDPEKVFTKLIREKKIKKVIANHDYEPYAIKRDESIRSLLRQHDINFETFKDQVIFERDEIVKDNGEPYVVFTPYSKRWFEKFDAGKIDSYASQGKIGNCITHEYPFLSLKDIGFEKSDTDFPTPDTKPQTIESYEDNRNFPALDATSHVSLDLRFGAVSIRKLVHKAAGHKNKTYLKELVWREFFMQILWHFPKTVSHAFKPEYDNIKWRYSDKDFEKWASGKTGYPIVDAGMRELNQTGYMHNRVRMVTASFLCKHLLLDWRRGEAYFAQKLLDYEQSSNIGNWQWAAGSGVDAAPYFRIFNPSEQQKKFDKDFEYIKKWVPEFGSDEYPQPMVDHKEARDRCLKVYKEGLNR
ncbi:cryptochrome/photolyase family protein [Flavobacterium silvaticum]|uniref:Deoxyribodipyrimidine photo-lyase n=1 Tax=Flavobacterium silvaticum TaxID=1852020 RepID=A0A972FWG7_9FLAO|nr:deoxyribodipyrimidine photo-lyase [Flavobacterium silvaticum]NMH28910.1 deoxyribodipyrimidine photo-lyase [Flavobacterium silvaticum]